MKKITIGLLVFAFFSLGVPSAFASDAPLDVQIFLGQNSIKSGMMFLVAAKVKGEEDASVNMWCHSCAFEKQWEVDVPNVFIQPWTCHEDSMEKVTLDGAHSYEKNLILYIKKTDETGPVTFRLGFKQMTRSGDTMMPVWSNAVTLDVIVTEEMKAAAAQAAQIVQDQIATVELSESMPDEAIHDSDSDEDVDPDLANKTP